MGQSTALAVPRQRQLLALLGLEEGVGEGDGVDPRHARILIKLRVDVEEDGHVHFLVRVQPLLFKAETLRERDTHTHCVSISRCRPFTTYSSYTITLCVS